MLLNECWWEGCYKRGDTSYRLVSEGTGEFLCDVDDMPMPLCPQHLIEAIEWGLDRIERELQNERNKMDDWPDSDLLLQYVKESKEHERAWRIIAGLSKRLLQERGENALLKKAGGITPTYRRSSRTSAPLVGPKPESWNDRIQSLEARLVKQKEANRKLEECRAFEAETEKRLAKTLEDIRTCRVPDVEYVRLLANEALIEYRTRQGPRPS